MFKADSMANFMNQRQKSKAVRYWTGVVTGIIRDIDITADRKLSRIESISGTNPILIVSAKPDQSSGTGVGDFGKCDVGDIGPSS